MVTSAATGFLTFPFGGYDGITLIFIFFDGCLCRAFS